MDMSVRVSLTDARDTKQPLITRHTATRLACYYIILSACICGVQSAFDTVVAIHDWEYTRRTYFTAWTRQ